MPVHDQLDIQTTNALPSSPADRLKLRTMISEATYCLQRADDEREALKDIVVRIHEDYGISKKHANRMIRALYKQNYADQVAEEEEFEFLYEGLFNTGTTPPVEEDPELDDPVVEETDGGESESTLP